MKRFFARTVAALAAASLLAFSAAAQYTDSLLVAGDSIATGFKLSGYDAGNPYSAEKSFGSLLADECGLTDGESYVNIAVDGMTTAELLALLSTADTQAQVASAQTLVISIGGNDLLGLLMSMMNEAIVANKDSLAAQGVIIDETSEQAIAGTIGAAMSADTDGKIMAMLMESIASDTNKARFVEAATASAENFSAITAAIAQLNPTIKLYFLNVYNPFKGMSGMEKLAEVADEALAALNEVIAQTVNGAIAAGIDANLVDVSGAFGDNGLIYTNILIMDIHPNVTGHSMIYSTILEDLSSAATEAEVEETDAEAVSEEVEGTTPEVERPEEEKVEDTAVEADGIDIGGAVETKGNPQTGVESVAGFAAAAGVAVLALKRRK